MTAMWRIFWSLSLCLLVAAGRVLAADPAPAEAAATIDAKNLRVDRKANMAYGEGDVVLRYKDLTMRADKARYNMATDEIWAEGNVRLNRTGQEWVLPAAYYNLKTQALKADTARGTFDAVTLRGDNVQMTASNKYSVSRATMTTCDYEQPHYRLEATRAEIWPGSHVRLYNVTLRLGNVPVFWFPVMAWSLKDDQTAPVAVVVGQGSREGFFILTRTRVAINQNIHATFRVDERTKRGPGVGVDLDYYYYGTVQGGLKGYYTRDSSPTDEVDRLFGRTIPSNRYRAEWQHKQQFQNDVDLTVNIVKQSDTDFMADFFPSRYEREGEPDSVVDVTKRGENYTLSALARPQLNPFYAEVERVPEARWSVNRVRIGQTPLFYEGESSAGYYHNVAGRTNDPLFQGSSPRADTFHQLVLPQQYFGWLSIIPRVGVRATYYLNAPEGAPDTNEVHRLSMNAGLESSFKVSRTWEDVESKLWDIHGLRHILEPFVDYQWVPSPSIDPNDLSQFDTYRFMTLKDGSRMLVTRYSALDFPANTAIDALGRQNVARFGVRQKLQTRRNGQPWDLVTLDLWTDYNFEETAMGKDFSDLFTTLRLSPSRWWAVDAGARFAFREEKFRELNTALVLHDQDRWRLDIGTRYLENDSNLVGGMVSYRMTRHWRFIMNQRMDMQDGTWEEQEYMLQQETHDWLLNYGFRRTGQRVRSDDNTFFVSVSLKAFPSLRIGQH